MHFESPVLQAKRIESRESKYMRLKICSCYFARLKDSVTEQTAFSTGWQGTMKNKAINKVEIRRPYSALLWRERGRMEKEPITNGKNAKYARARKIYKRARKRSYF